MQIPAYLHVNRESVLFVKVGECVDADLWDDLDVCEW